MSSIIEKDIAVAPVEYVTKYSLNRNFLKLVENDKALSAMVSEREHDTRLVGSYLPGRIYAKDECAFYKTSEDSQTLYMLCSVIKDNVYVPLTSYDVVSNIVVVNDEHWAIAGLNDGISANPKDYATEYIAQSTQHFLSAHQLNLDLSAHPTKELGVDKSTVLFTSLDNIGDDRSMFFYPSHVQTLNPDNSIVAGYMRKWDDGMLEYDILFRVGYGGEKTDTGLDIVSANNLEVYHRNYNNLYFRDNADFGIFNNGAGHFAALNGMKQVNLNAGMNAYYAEVKFPQEFKDLNYMVFTSNVKNVDVESYNLKNNALDGKHDKRLRVSGLNVIGYIDDADWSKPVQIPPGVKSIDKDALSFMKETNSVELKVEMLSSSSLVNIGDNAFDGSDIRQVTIPMNVKCVGYNAFASCKKLARVDMFINEDISKQPVLDYSVFTGCTSLGMIVLHYFNEDRLHKGGMTMFSMSAYDADRMSMYTDEDDLSTKLNDTEIRGLYGISEDVVISVINETSYSMESYMPLRASTAQSVDMLHDQDADMLQQDVSSSNSMQNVHKDEDVNFVTIDVKDFLAKLNHMKQVDACAVQQANAHESMLVATNAKSSAVEDAAEASDVCISCGQLSGQAFSYGSLDSLSVVGDSIDCTISACVIEHLVISGFNAMSSSFISAQHVGHLDVLPGQSGMKICNGAFSGLNVKTMRIDMTSSYLDRYALSGVTAENISLMNFSKAYEKPFVNRLGLGQMSFAGCKACNINVLSDESQLYDVIQLHKMLSSNIQRIADGCSIDNDTMRASCGKVIMKPSSMYLYISHVDDAYDYSAVSCDWNAVADDYALTWKDFTCANALKDVVIEVPEGVESICSNAFSAGLSSIYNTGKRSSKKAHSPVTHVIVASTVKHIAKDVFNDMPCLKDIMFK